MLLETRHEFQSKKFKVMSNSKSEGKSTWLGYYVEPSDQALEIERAHGLDPHLRCGGQRSGRDLEVRERGLDIWDVESPGGT